MYMYYDDQNNSVPAAAGAVATSHTVFLLNRVQDVIFNIHCSLSQSAKELEL